MDAWHRRWLGQAQTAASRQELAAIAGEATRTLGFERFRYVQSVWLLHSRTVVLALDKQLPARHPQGAASPDTEPAIAHCRHSNQPFVWHAATGAGWAQGVSSPQALGVRGILSLMRGGPALEEDELHRLEPLLSMVCKTLHEAMLRVDVPTAGTPLTEREREVLRWAAVGKTTTEVARILAVSDNTIKFHIKNATQKLGTANKTAAVVKAVLMGLLH